MVSVSGGFYDFKAKHSEALLNEKSHFMKKEYRDCHRHPIFQVPLLHALLIEHF